MATEFWVRDSGAWRKAKEVWVRDATNWRKAKEVWVKDATGWRKVYQGFQFIADGNTNMGCGVTAQDDSEFGQRDTWAECGVYVYNDGTFLKYGTSGPYGPWAGLNTYGNWGTPATSGAGAAYHVRLRMVSGDNPNYQSNSVNTWISLAGTVAWKWRVDSWAAKYASYFIDFSDNGGSTYTATLYVAAYIDWHDIAGG